MTDNVTRLPVQHPRKPHCQACDRDLPPLEGVGVIAPPGAFGDCALVTVIFRVRCVCGALVDMEKKKV